MKKIIFFFILLGGLIIPVFALADVNWSSPIGNVWFPITISANWNESDIISYQWGFELGIDDADDSPSGNYNICGDWIVSFVLHPASELGGEAFITAEDLGITQENMDCINSHPEIINYVRIAWWDDQMNLVGYYNNSYFTLSEKLYNIIPLKSDFTSKILSYPKNLGSNVKDLIYLIIGLPLAFWSVRKIIGLTKLG
jgi:hypothetical protein